MITGGKVPFCSAVTPAPLGCHAVTGATPLKYQVRLAQGAAHIIQGT